MASPLILQPDAAAGKDTWIYSAAADTNLGTDADIVAGDSSSGDIAHRTLLAPPSLPPAGAVITSVTLSLWEYLASRTAEAPASWAVELRQVLRSWVEAEATWNIYSTGNNWATAGCGNATDRADTPCASVTLDGTAANDFITWSGAGLVALAQAWTDGTAANYGVLLSAPTAEYQGAAGLAYNYFHSSDYTADAAKRPKWTFEYVMPGTLPVRSIGSGIGSGIASGTA